MAIKNETMSSYQFLTEMYEDDYFPTFLVDKCKAILIALCESIEVEMPRDVDGLLKLTHAAVESINQLEAEFEENDSELETAARETRAEDFGAILNGNCSRAGVWLIFGPIIGT